MSTQLKPRTRGLINIRFLVDRKTNKFIRVRAAQWGCNMREAAAKIMKQVADSAAKDVAA